MKFSLVIPCFNEAENLPLLLDRCKSMVSQQNIEIILVNNGSTDNSAAVLNDLLPNYQNCRSVHVKKNKGYGFGIISGLRESTGDVVGWTHADLQTNPQDALLGFELFKKHGENIFVKGRRYGRPFADVLFTTGMSVFETMLLQKPLWDINAQPTIFPRTFFETWNDAPYDFSLDLYAYYQASCNNLEIYRFPVKFGERVHGVSHWNVNWAAKKNFIRRTVSFSLQLRRGLKQ